MRTWDCRTPFRVIERLPVEVSAVSRNCCYQGDCTHWPTSGLLRFFADFDQVPFSVADFKEMHVAPILDGSSKNAAIGKMFVGLL